MATVKSLFAIGVLILGLQFSPFAHIFFCQLRIEGYRETLQHHFSRAISHAYYFGRPYEPFQERKNVHSLFIDLLLPVYSLFEHVCAN